MKEAKGLDMVRRDWCGLAKDCGNFALDRILSGQPCEEVVDAIHAKLQEVCLPSECAVLKGGKACALKWTKLVATLPWTSSCPDSPARNLWTPSTPRCGR